MCLQNTWTNIARKHSFLLHNIDVSRVQIPDSFLSRQLFANSFFTVVSNFWVLPRYRFTIQIRAKSIQGKNLHPHALTADKQD